MRQEYDENLLLGYVEGELTDVERARVEQWIAVDPGLASLLAGMVEDRKALRELSDPPTPDWVLDDIDSGLERSMLLEEGYETDASVIEQKRNVLVRLSTYGAIAAMLLLGVFFVVQPLLDLHPENVAVDDATETEDNTPHTDGEVAMDDIQPRSAVGGDVANVRSKGGSEIDAVETETVTHKKAAGGEPTERVFVGKGGHGAIGKNDKQFTAERPADVGHAQADPRQQGVMIAAVETQTDPHPLRPAGRLVRDSEPEHIEVTITTDDLELTALNINNLVNEFEEIEVQQVAAAPAVGQRQNRRAFDDAVANVSVADATDAETQHAEATTAKTAPRDRAKAAADTGPELPGPGLAVNNFQLVVPRAQANALIDRLRDEGLVARADQAPTATNAQVTIARRQLTDAERDRYRSDLWPSYSPDYRAILKRVVPVDEGPAQRIAAAEQQRIEVIVEQRTPPAQPAATTPEEPAPNQAK